MRNIQIIVLLIVVWSISTLTYAQDSCQIALVNASEAFDRGQYNEVIALLEKRIDRCGYTSDARMQAQKMLAASYSELDDLEQAEAVTRKFIKSNPVYVLQSIDPSQFASTFEKYSVSPRFSVGVSMGIQKPKYQIKKRFIPWDASGYTSSYSVDNQFSFNINAQWNVFSRLSLGGEFGISTLSYTRNVRYGNLYSISYTENSTQMLAPIYLSYSLCRAKMFSFSVLSGFYGYKYSGFNYSYTNLYAGTTGKGSGSLNSSGRNFVGWGLVEGLKFSYLFNRFTFNLEPRYYINQTLFNKPDERYSNSGLSINQMYVDDDFSINRMEVLLGVSYTLSYKIKHKYH